MPDGRGVLYAEDMRGYNRKHPLYTRDERSRSLASCGGLSVTHVLLYHLSFVKNMKCWRKANLYILLYSQSPSVSRRRGRRSTCECGGQLMCRRRHLDQSVTVLHWHTDPYRAATRPRRHATIPARLRPSPRSCCHFLIILLSNASLRTAIIPVLT